MAGPISIDTTIIEIAGRQGGLCTRAQLKDGGLSEASIDRRLRNGFLHRVGRGVYRAGGVPTPLEPLHRAMCLVPGATLSHTTAARLHRFPLDPTDDWQPVHIIVPNGFNRRIDGVLIHPRRKLPDPADLTTLHGIPVTGLAYTICDLASVVGPSRLRHIIQAQVQSNNPSVDELLACAAARARPGVNGASVLRRTLGELFGQQPIAQSKLEHRLTNLLIMSDISGFQPQFRPPWYDGIRGVVDFAHTNLRIVLEADGRRWHQRDQDMTTDRRRDRAAARHGWITVRVTWADVTRRPTETVDDLCSIMTTRRAA